ncbi:MAG: hypothetical protein OEO77_16165, partial [Acidimicrobiia bacterium]|nr:hypothetical protein [Acidimicrobiia bacterium]
AGVWNRISTSVRLGRGGATTFRTVTSHCCPTCSPGPDRILDHERGIVRVPRGFRGPPNSMHRGAAAGMVACLGDAHLAGPTVRFNVRLHGPPPLETDLPYVVEADDGGPCLTFRIGEGENTVLSGWAATSCDEPVVPADTVAELAAHAMLGDAGQNRFAGHVQPEDEEFSECFGCGTGNEVGLRLKTRPINDRQAWIEWKPDSRWIDNGMISTSPAIAALDCTSAMPLQHLGFMEEQETSLLGTYDGQIHRRPPVRPDDKYRIVTSPRRRDGRRVYADIGLFDPEDARSHHQHQLGGRANHGTDVRALLRQQVGGRGPDRDACHRGCDLRHPGQSDRARRRRHADPGQDRRPGS